MGTLPDLVNSFLIAPSVAVSSYLENPIAKVLEHDAAFSMVLNFRLEYTYSSLLYNTVLLNLLAGALSHVYAILTLEGFSLFIPCILVAGHDFLFLALTLKMIFTKKRW